MIEPPQPSLRDAIFKTAQGRVIGALVIVALVIGIAFEAVQLMTAIVNYDKVKYERDSAGAIAKRDTAVIGSPRASPLPPKPLRSKPLLQTDQSDAYFTNYPALETFAVTAGLFLLFVWLGWIVPMRTVYFLPAVIGMAIVAPQFNSQLVSDGFDRVELAIIGFLGSLPLAVLPFAIGRILARYLKSKTA
jgi:hypothetical protein